MPHCKYDLMIIDSQKIDSVCLHVSVYIFNKDWLYEGTETSVGC